MLVTKDSGAEGGFAEKVRAARGLGMRVAALAKPEEAGGVSLEEAISLLRPLSF
ncbi:MAG: precorrin-6A/cobalt-precorrin-6A reductase [Clostridiales bacterium]|nr:precorrin-6A/cobalt-precorrin-6A reductase [Clostridiales bacterium]